MGGLTTIQHYLLEEAIELPKLHAHSGGELGRKPEIRQRDAIVEEWVVHWCARATNHRPRGWGEVQVEM